MKVAPPDLNQAMLQWFNELASQGILITDHELVVRGWNHWLEIHSGLRAAEVLGCKLPELYPDLVERQLARYYDQALAGQVVVLSHRLHRYLLPMAPDPDQVAFMRMQQSARISPLMNNGQIVGTVTMIEDVTERVMREDRLRFLAEASVLLSSSLDYRATLHSVLCSAVPTLADWCTVDLLHENGVVEPIVQVHADQARQEWLRRLVQIEPPDCCPGYALAQVLRSGQPTLVAEVTGPLVASSGDAEAQRLLEQLGPRSYIIVPLIARERTLGAMAFVMGESGRRYGAADLQLVEDLARRAALTIDNTMLYEEAQRSVQMRDQFLTIAAHELKNPMTSLLGYTQLLQRRLEQSGVAQEREQRLVGSLLEQARRLHRLVATLFDLSRIQIGQLSVERRPVNIALLVERLTHELQPTLERHNLQYSGPDEPVIIEGDELRLEQVLYNLLQNAVRYSPDGGAIVVCVRLAPGQVVIEVSDQGIGVPLEEIPHLFEHYYRASNVENQYSGGLGLGLALVREIVTLHGGSVEVESLQGQGSTFRLLLPLSTQRASQDSPG